MNTEVEQPAVKAINLPVIVVAVIALLNRRLCISRDCLLATHRRIRSGSVTLKPRVIRFRGKHSRRVRQHHRVERREGGVRLRGAVGLPGRGLSSRRGPLLRRAGRAVHVARY